MPARGFPSQKAVEIHVPESFMNEGFTLKSESPALSPQPDNVIDSKSPIDETKK
jgi:hypothetical protein